MTTLNATDASFLYAETRDCPMSIASLQFMALPENVTPEEFVQGLKAFLLKRKDLVPYLTNKVQFDSGVFGHPNWVKDHAFDIDNHVYSVSVPAPGERKQVEQTVARLHEKPLDRSRPLWDLVVLTGLPGHTVAYYNRVHHACLDGMASQASTQVLMDNDPIEPEVKQALPSNSSAPLTLSGHLHDLFEAMLTQSIDRLVAAPRRAASLNQLWQRALAPGEGFGSTTALCPPTPLNINIDRSRTYAYTELPLNRFKQIAKLTGGTVNDVFLAVCGGALKQYLDRRQALPEQTLIAGCPVSMRQNDDRANNNQVAMMRVALGTHIADARERLAYVRRSAMLAKEILRDTQPLMPADLSLPAMGLSVRGAQLINGLLRTADRVAPPINVLISNVPGPRQTLYSNGARMLSHYPISIPTHGIGVNITVQSYGATLYVGITGAARAIPDADRLRDDIDQSFAALYNALNAEIVDLQHAKDSQSRTATKKKLLENDRVIGPRGQVA